MDFKDTQCGAKIMSKEVIEKHFKKKFWLNGCLMLKYLWEWGIYMVSKETKKMVCEKPLNRWVHMDGSKLSFRDSLKLFSKLVK
jgi:hypothetical protein